MNHTVQDVLAFVRENDVKFIRLVFCDLFGRQKNISIMPGELEDAFRNGVSFDASAIQGFSGVANSDLFLKPDPSTLSLMPWRPGPGRVLRFYCDIETPDGAPFIGDSRTVLKAAIHRCEEMGYHCRIGAECEFYLFKTDEDGNPTEHPLDQGGYLDIAPIDKGENIRREICLCMEEMGLQPESSHHEQGPGQNEIVFKFGDALSCADNLMFFKSTVKAIASRNGLFASFMPKPIPGESGSGLHVNLSLSENGKNIFQHSGEGYSQPAAGFIAGILAKTREITLFLNPIINSYDRFGRHLAPKYVSWSHQNRSQLVRIPASSGEKNRMELRSPDPSLNPYLAFALILHAGLDGVENKLPLPAPVNENLFRADSEVLNGLEQLPQDLPEAIVLAEESALIKRVIPEELREKYIKAKKLEAERFDSSPSREAFYKGEYFSVI